MVNMNNNSSTTTFPCDCIRLSFTSNFSLCVKSFVFKSCLQICNHYSLSTAYKNASRSRTATCYRAAKSRPRRGRAILSLPLANAAPSHYLPHHLHLHTVEYHNTNKICTKNNLIFIYVGFDFPRYRRKT